MNVDLTDCQDRVYRLFRKLSFLLCACFQMDGQPTVPEERLEKDGVNGKRKEPTF